MIMNLISRKHEIIKRSANKKVDRANRKKDEDAADNDGQYSGGLSKLVLNDQRQFRNLLFSDCRNLANAFFAFVENRNSDVRMADYFADWSNNTSYERAICPTPRKSEETASLSSNIQRNYSYKISVLSDFFESCDRIFGNRMNAGNDLCRKMTKFGKDSLIAGG